LQAGIFIHNGNHASEGDTMSTDLSYSLSYQQGLAKFQSLQQRVFWQEKLSQLTGRKSELLNFEDIRSRLNLRAEHHKGIRDVPLANIIGSVGRHQDFTATFLPKSRTQGQRWSRIYALAHSQQGLPPVDLYQVGDVYFVRDGNHRVSVARQLGAATIEANVVDLPTTVPLRPGMTARDLEAAEAYVFFLDETGLERAVPKHEPIELTAPSRYHELMGHIFLHQRVLENLQGKPIPTEEATADWYHTLYHPAIKLIRKYDVLELVKKRKAPRTEADLFLWLMLNLLESRQQYGLDAPVKSFSVAIRAFLQDVQVKLPAALAQEQDEALLLSREQALRAASEKRQQEQDKADSLEVPTR